MTAPFNPEVAVPARPSRRPGRLPVIMLTVLGLAGVLGGGAALARELTRPPTRAETAAAVQQEIATRWERLPAGSVFPSALRYTDAQGGTATALRVGIAPPASCRAALEAAAYQRIGALGCTTMLRATYVDAGGTLAVTVGIGVMPSPAAAQSAESTLTPIAPAAGLHAVVFGGTVAATFSDTGRASSGGLYAGPYLLLYTAGSTEGVPAAVTATGEELDALANGLATAILNTLTDHGSACTMKDIRC